MLKGEFVRFGPNSLSINTNTGLKSIYGFHANVVKSDFYRVIATNKGYSTHSCIDRELHAHKRYILLYYGISSLTYRIGAYFLTDFPRKPSNRWKSILYLM